MGAGLIDAELAALLVLLVGSRVPVVVAGPPGASRDELVDALVALIPADATVVELAGAAEEFEWLPEAVELGWQRERGVLPAIGLDAAPRASASTTIMLTRHLAGVGPNAPSGARARMVVRALAMGYGLVAGMTADGLDGVFARLGDPAVGTDEDERSRLGLVLALGEPAVGTRLLAAHYVRPLARDVHGHLQRLPPAVLATWSPDRDRWDHFAWGVVPELASRTGRRPIELERDQARIAAALRSEAATAS